MDNERLNQAISLAKRGEIREARRILEDLVWREPENIQAWAWLADSMPSPKERLDILLEGVQQNPGNTTLQRILAASDPKEASGPRSSAPLDLPAGSSSSRNSAFELDTGELRSLSDHLDAVPEEPKAEVDWLQSRHSSSSESTAQVDDGTYPPAIQFDANDTPFDPNPTPNDDQRVVDWLASLDSPQLEDSPSVSAKTNAPGPQLGKPPVLGGKPKTENIKSQPLDEQPGLASKPLLTGSAASVSPSSKERGEQPGQPRWLDPLKKGVPQEVLPVEELDFEMDDPPPRRRSMRGDLVVIVLGLFVVAAVLIWPKIQETATQLWVNAPTEPVAAMLITTPELSNTPSPTLTRTPSPTATFTPLPTSTRTTTATPIPFISRAEMLAPENLQQFRSLASVHARGCVALDPRLLAGLADAQTVRIWDFLSEQPLIDLKGPKANIQQAAISPDGRLAAAASEEPAVWVWNIQTGKVVATYEFSADLVSQYADKSFSRTLQVQFSPDSKAVFASSLLGVTWWDLQNGQERHLFPLLVNELKTFREQAIAPTGKNATSFLISFSPDGKSLAVGSPYKVYILDWPGANGKATLSSAKPLAEMRWMQNGLLGLYQPGQVAVWDTILNKQVQIFYTLKSQSAALPANAGFRLDGKWAAVEVENARGLPGGLKIVELPGGKTLLSVDSRTDSPVENPLFSPDGRLLFGRSGGDLFVWDTSSGKELRRIANRRGFSQISADGKIYVELAPAETGLWGVAQVP